MSTITISANTKTSFQNQTDRKKRESSNTQYPNLAPVGALTGAEKPLKLWSHEICKQKRIKKLSWDIESGFTTQTTWVKYQKCCLQAFVLSTASLEASLVAWYVEIERWWQIRGRKINHIFSSFLSQLRNVGLDQKVWNYNLDEFLKTIWGALQNT